MFTQTRIFPATSKTFTSQTKHSALWRGIKQPFPLALLVFVRSFWATKICVFVLAFLRSSANPVSPCGSITFVPACTIGAIAGGTSCCLRVLLSCPLNSRCHLWTHSQDFAGKFMWCFPWWNYHFFFLRLFNWVRCLWSKIAITLVNIFVRATASCSCS